MWLVEFAWFAKAAFFRIEKSSLARPHTHDLNKRALVTAGPTGSAPAPATVAKVDASAIQRALSWQERRLEFDAVPLAEVAREFNRYNRRQLVIADPALAAKRFSGTFRADSYEPFVRLLEDDFGVVAMRTEHAITLRPAR